MNIILLSGGSGKRLWPLSNDVRSKQFIKLFKNNGEYESMVQRVYRQITTVDADAKVTIATSKSQASAIKNQLGEKASICVEPCRRDTFPAIALAAAYLHDEMNVGENASNLTTFQDDYEELVKYVKNNVRNARIILVGDFWTNVEQEKMKKMVAKTLQIPYADLSAIQNDNTYQAGLGTMVEGADGVQHKIEHEGVAGHPGDKGMKWIAERIFDCL